MELELKDLVYLAFILITGTGAFFGTRSNLIDKIQKTKDQLHNKISRLELEIERLKGKDENQQQIIDQFQKQILDHLPDLFEILKDKTVVKADVIQAAAGKVKLVIGVRSELGEVGI